MYAAISGRSRTISRFVTTYFNSNRLKVRSASSGISHAPPETLRDGERGVTETQTPGIRKPGTRSCSESSRRVHRDRTRRNEVFSCAVGWPASCVEGGSVADAELGVGLAEAVEQVRVELEDAIKRGEGSSVAFETGPVEMEFEVVFAASGGGDVGFACGLSTSRPAATSSQNVDEPLEDRVATGGPCNRKQVAHRGTRRPVIGSDDGPVPRRAYPAAPSTGDGPPFRFGSGYVVRQGQVLTAAHVLVAADPNLAVDELDTVHVGDRCSIATWDALKLATTADDIHWIDATVSAVDPASDVAVIAVEGIGDGMPPVRFGRLDGEEPVRWSAVGFPNAGLTEQGDSPSRAWGDVDAVTNEFDERLGMTVRSREPGLMTWRASGWAGLSGAAVFVNAYPHRSRRRGHATLRAQPHWRAHHTGAPARRRCPSVRGPGDRADRGRDMPVAGETGYCARRRRPSVRRGGRVARPRRTAPVVARHAARRAAHHQRRRPSGHREERGRGQGPCRLRTARSCTAPLEDLDGLVYLSPRTGVAALTPAHVYESIATLAEPEEANNWLAMWDHLQLEAFSSLWSTLRHRRVVVVLDHLDDLQNQRNPGTHRQRSGCVAGVGRPLTPHPPRVVTTSRQRLKLPPELLRA